MPDFFFDSLILAQACQDAGIRGIVGKVAQDQNSPEFYVETTQQSLETSEAFLNQIDKMLERYPPHQRLVRAALAPRFLPTCTEDLLRGLGKLAKKRDCLLLSHMCESDDEVAFSSSLWRDRHEVGVWDQLGLLTPNTIQAHCTHLKPEDLDLLKSRGTSIAHCPLSNTYFSERPFPLREAMTVGVHVGLGADIAGGYSLSMNQGMRSALQVSRTRQGRLKSGQPDPFAVASQSLLNSKNLAIGWKESLYLATHGGAQAVGMANIGLFKEGHVADIQIIKLGGKDSSIDLFRDEMDLSNEDMVEKWFCNGTKQDRNAVYVAGRLLFCRK